ncbi:MAG: class I SAM-dependent methyltransferase [Bacilli bacterium]|nr:class I SAM-dependent methyltransferase [Bacilli bacterium]
MKFNLKENDIKELEALFSIHEDNLYASDIVNAYLSSPHEDDETLFSLYRKKGMKEQEAMSMIFDQIVGDEELEDYPRISNLYGFHSLKKLDANVYENISYYHLLKKVSLKEKDVRLVHPSYYPYEAFLAGEIHVDEEGREMMALGYFDKPFHFPALTKGKKTWMSLIPHEIETMAPAIKKAKGRIATLGLGLGYFAFAASSKKEVTSLDIIEFDPSVIALFKKALLPLFPHKEKIRIIQGDAIKYLKENETPYDYVYADLWHREDDALPLYKELKKVEAAKKVQMDYWIERSILAYFRRIVITLLNEEYRGATDDDYQTEESFLDALINSLHRNLKDESFGSIEEIKAFLAEDSLKELVKKL